MWTIWFTICLFGAILNLSKANFLSIQLDALSDLFNATNGNEWQWKDDRIHGNHWNFSGTNINPCAEYWQGIHCVDHGGISYVTNLTLRGYNLYGTIPSSISYLQNLTFLDLSHNRLFSTLPDSVCHLMNLTVFTVQSNYLSGILPARIGELALLEVLNVRNNAFLSSLPASMANMTQLKRLDLGCNRFDGLINIFSQGLFGLQLLSLEKNRFEGTLPSSLLSTRPYLRAVDVSENLFIGRFPLITAPLLELIFMDLSSNNLTGTLPESIGLLQNFLHMNVSHNDFEGTLPTSITTLKYLITLKCSINRFHGSIPHGIYNLSYLEDIDLSVNNFSGTLPESLFNLTSLQNIQLAANNFEGTLSSSVGSLRNLLLLELGGNAFTGPIPNKLSSLTKLQYLFLQNNYFTSTLPSSLYVIPKLSYLDLSDNLLEGTISPAWLSAQNLVLFYVASNNFHGSIVQLINSLQVVVSLNVSHNAFYGSLPSGFGINVLVDYSINNNQFTGNLLDAIEGQNILQIADVGTNYLTGELGGLLSSQELQFFYAQDNYLSCTIAPAFSSRLKELWLSNNMLSGTISGEIGQAMNLSALRLYANRFTGALPEQLSHLTNLSLLFLNGNSFRGDAQVVFDPQHQTQMLNIDISDNQFSGSLPVSFFASKSLTSFAASSNCFTGTLSPFMCNVTTLTALILDALSAAPACQVPIITGFSSFTLHDNKRVYGTIPSCLFGMPNLQGLHLSGNALSGTLPDDLYVSPSMQVLALAHNALVGEVPSSIIQRPWLSLVINVNKLRGILPSNIPSITTNGSLYLNINRFSGPIPERLLNASTIWAVEGNIFDCNLFQTNLPKHDPKAKEYTCGSDSTNRALISWGVVLFICLLIFLLIRHFDVGLTPSRMTRALAQLEQWGVVIEREAQRGRDQSGLVAMDRLFQDIRLLFALFTVVAIFFCMPIYIALSYHYSTHSYTYVWTSSALYLSGFIPALCLWLVFSLIILLRWVVVAYYLRGRMLRGNQEKSRRHYWILYLLYSLINIIVMGVVDVVYVFAINNLGPGLSGLSEVALAVFKLVWNEVYVMKSYIPMKKRVISFLNAHEIENKLRDLDDWRYETWRWMRGRPPSVPSRANSLQPTINNLEQQREQSQVNPMRNFFQSEYKMDDSIIDVEEKTDFSYQDSFPNTSTIDPVSTISMIGMSGSAIGLSTVARDGSTLTPHRAAAAAAAAAAADNNNINEERKTDSTAIPQQSPAFERRDTNTTVVGMESIFESNDTTVIAFNMVLNFLAVPAIAVLFVSPNCFSGIFYPPTTVPGSFDYTYCANFETLGRRSSCSTYETGTQSISYDAPFTYSYTCSADLVTYYAAAYVYQMIMTALGIPLLKVLLKFIASRCKEERICMKVQFRRTQQSKRSMCCTPSGTKISCSCYPFCCLSCAKFSTTCVICKSNAKAEPRLCLWCYTCWYNRIRWTTNFLLPANLRSLQEEPWSRSLTLFDQFFIPRMYTLFAAIMYYGIVFPPIAPAIMLAAFSTLNFEEIVICRLLDKIAQECEQKARQKQIALHNVDDAKKIDLNAFKPRYGWYVQRLNEEADGIEDRFTHPWLMILTFIFVTLLYAYIIYDSAADQYGYKIGFLPSAAIVVVPIAIYFVRWWTSDRVLGECGRAKRGINVGDIARMEANVNDRSASESYDDHWRDSTNNQAPVEVEMMAFAADRNTVQSEMAPPSFSSNRATMQTQTDVEGLARRGRGLLGVISAAGRAVLSPITVAAVDESTNPTASGGSVNEPGD